MNLVVRALTQNLRDIRANWTGASGWLGRIAIYLLVLAGSVTLGQWAGNRLAGDTPGTARLLLSEAVRAVSLGAGFAFTMVYFWKFDGSARNFLVMWCFWSAWWFLLHVEVPWMHGTFHPARIASAGMLIGVSLLMREPIRRFIGSRPREQEPSGPSRGEGMPEEAKSP